MTHTAHTSPELPAPAGPYSHVVRAGDAVWTAGFGPQDPATGRVPDGIQRQTEGYSHVAAMNQDVGEWVKRSEERRTNPTIGVPTQTCDDVDRRQLRATPRKLINRPCQAPAASGQPHKH